jgi:hypothetical protein
LKVETDDVLVVVEAVEDTEIEVADPDEPVTESALDNADEKAVETAEEKTSPEDRAVAVAVFVVDMEGYPRRSGANDHGSFVLDVGDTTGEVFQSEDVGPMSEINDDSRHS